MHASRGPASCLLVTGKPGIGKSTAVAAALADMVARPHAGFISSEMRENGKRQGFRIKTLRSNRSGVLASPSIESPVRFGSPRPDGLPRLGVDLEFLRKHVVPELHLAATEPECIVVVDELGPMQASAPELCEAVDALLDGSWTAIGSIAEARGHQWLDQVKGRANVHQLRLTTDNRAQAPRQLLDFIRRRATESTSR
jgi:nucleoside-triphosphatase